MVQSAAPDENAGGFIVSEIQEVSDISRIKSQTADCVPRTSTIFAEKGIFKFENRSYLARFSWNIRNSGESGKAKRGDPANFGEACYAVEPRIFERLVWLSSPHSVGGPRVQEMVAPAAACVRVALRG